MFYHDQIVKVVMVCDDSVNLHSKILIHTFLDLGLQVHTHYKIRNLKKNQNERPVSHIAYMRNNSHYIITY